MICQRNARNHHSTGQRLQMQSGRSPVNAVHAKIADRIKKIKLKEEI